MLRLATRNLLRNRWRSGLTAGGVAVAVALLIWAEGMMGGFLDKMVESVTGTSLGHVQVHSPAYVDEPSIFHAFDLDEAALAEVRGAASVAAASPRLFSGGLMGNARRGRLVQVVGVDAQHEQALTRVAERVQAGAWLTEAPAPYPAAREVVLGHLLATQLEVGPGDELDIFVMSADGAQRDEILRVVGTLKTGNVELDRAAVYMHLADLQYVTRLDGRAHELAVRLERGAELAEGKAAVADALPDGLTVRSWTEIVPELHQMIELSSSAIWIFYLVIYLVAALGVLNTQRMSALERRREFGVLLAIGTRPGRLARTIVAESALLCVVGGLLGAALGGAITAYHATAGLDLGLFTSDGEGAFSWMGIRFDDRVYFSLDAGSVVVPLALIGVVGLLCGLWPAIQSARLDITRAIAGRG